MAETLRIVHAAQFQLNKDGARYFNTDQKIQQGLVRLGHLVYAFSINDVARMHSPLNNKSLGQRAANRALIRTCRNIRPHLLLLGHAQSITADTLAIIRNELPDIRIALWYVDPLWDPKDIEHIYARRHLLDGIFATTAGPMLEALATDSCFAAYMPNPVDPSIECHRCFEKSSAELTYDLTYIGSDKRASDRTRLLEQVRDTLDGELRFGIFGSLGGPAVFGAEREAILAGTKMAINLSRRNDVPLYSSDRMAQLMGNGILTFCPDSAGFQELFGDDELVYFSDADDLAEKVRHYHAEDGERQRIAERGWRKIFATCSNITVTKSIVEQLVQPPAHLPSELGAGKTHP